MKKNLHGDISVLLECHSFLILHVSFFSDFQRDWSAINKTPNYIFNYKTNQTNGIMQSKIGWPMWHFGLEHHSGFSVVRSVVEHWLLKPGILGFRIPGSSVVAFLHQKCLHSSVSMSAMAVFVFQDSRHFHARFCPKPSEGLGGK